MKKKKWTWNEYNEWKKLQQQPAEEEQPVPAGRCKCGSAQFRLVVKHGKMNRICRGCGDVRENI